MPTWNLNKLYPSEEAFLADVRRAEETLTDTVSLAASGIKDIDSFRAILGELEEGIDLFVTLSAFAELELSVDASSKEGTAHLAYIDRLAVLLSRATTAFDSTLTPAVLDFCAADPSLSEYSLAIREGLVYKSHQMSPECEALAAELLNSGAKAWSRLQSSIFSTGAADFRGERKTIVELRGLETDPDRETRREALETELKIWKEHEIDVAFALNGVKGQALTMYKAHKYDDPLDVSCEKARISRKTLDALIAVLEKNLPMFRRYFRLKASALGLDKLAYYDIMAPVVEVENAVWSYDDARKFILNRVGEFNPEQRAFTEMAFDEGWIDSEPRPGKVGGAFDTYLPRFRESRVLANFDGSFDSVSTIAHELGHAYHDSLVKDKTALRRDYPMTLAETASTFNEFIVFRGALERAESEGKKAEQLSLIESFIAGAAQVCVDILCRFYFEREFFRLRAEGEVVPENLCNLMRECHKRTYGDAIDQESVHPYMWAVKTHYYDHVFCFYNYPYAFGELFGIGVYAKKDEWKENFLPNYKKILSEAGFRTANEITRDLGIDLESEEFWQTGMDVISSYVDRYEKLVKELKTGAK